MAIHTIRSHVYSEQAAATSPQNIHRFLDNSGWETLVANDLLLSLRLCTQRGERFIEGWRMGYEQDDRTVTVTLEHNNLPTVQTAFHLLTRHMQRSNIQIALDTEARRISLSATQEVAKV